MGTPNPMWMTGTQTINLVLLESTGTASKENWTATQRDASIAYVQTGLNWLKSLADKNHVPLQFSLDTRFATSPVPVTVEPVAMKFADRGQWISQFLAQQKIAGDHYTGTKAFNEMTKAATGSFGARTIYLVNSMLDVDDKFVDGYFAWSYFGGPYTVMTSGIAGWTDADLPKLVVHELMHQYGALDEYNDGTAYSSYNNISPTGTQNTNAIRDRPSIAPPRQNSIMGEATLLRNAYSQVMSSTPSLAMIFGPDTNKNGTPDWLA